MRRLIVLALLGLILAAPSTAAAQPLPGVNTPIGGLARTIAGMDVIKAQIAELRRQLSECDSPAASKTGACASRAILRAKLNYLLEVGVMLGDPDAAGAPPKPAEKPADANNYEAEFEYLREQLSRQPPATYIISENAAKYVVISHCRTMKDTERLAPYKTPEEIKASQDDQRNGKTRAAIGACIKEYDTKEIVANRKMALEYCVPATTNQYGERFLLNLCMHKHDMLTAMCRQEFDLIVAFVHHKDPQAQHQPQMCPYQRVAISPGEVQAIMAAAPVRTMAGLPPTFVAPLDVAIAPRPPLPIPAGTVIELRIPGFWDGAAIDNIENNGQPMNAALDQPLVIGGKTILRAPAAVNLKARIIGAGSRFEPVQTRPETVQIAFTIDEINIDDPERPLGHWADLKSNEVVFTVPYKSNINAGKPGLMSDTRVRFTLGVSGTVEAPSAQPPAAGRRTAAPAPAPAAPRPQTPPTPAPPTSDPQQRAEEARQRTERVQACVQQAIRDRPVGSIEAAQAIAACGQIK
jgi:hypothetical protein